MKRRTSPPRNAANALRAEIALLQSVVSALVIRLGGHVEMGGAEMKQCEGDRVDFSATTEGVVIHVHQSRRIVSPNGARMN